MRKRIIAITLLIVLLCTVSVSAAAHEVPDPDRLGSITVAMTYRGRPISGGSLTVYRVADVVSENGNMVFDYTDDFADCTIPVTDLESSRLPEALRRIARDKGLSGVTQSLGRDGKTVFSDLEIGLYLVVQHEAAPGYTRINPFLVSVPQNRDGHYIYDVDTAPKNIPGPEEIPTEPTEPTRPAEPPKPEDHLPQTGQLNWPVPVMAAAGMLLMVGGICLHVSGKRKRDEA